MRAHLLLLTSLMLAGCSYIGPPGMLKPDEKSYAELNRDGIQVHSYCHSRGKGLRSPQIRLWIQNQGSKTLSFHTRELIRVREANDPKSWIAYEPNSYRLFRADNSRMPSEDDSFTRKLDYREDQKINPQTEIRLAPGEILQGWFHPSNFKGEHPGPSYEFELVLSRDPGVPPKPRKVFDCEYKES